MNYVTEKIIEEAIITTDPDIIGISLVLDAEYKESSEVGGPVIKVPFFQVVQISFLSALFYCSRCEYESLKV